MVTWVLREQQVNSRRLVDSNWGRLWAVPRGSCIHSLPFPYFKYFSNLFLISNTSLTNSISIIISISPYFPIPFLSCVFVENLQKKIVCVWRIWTRRRRRKNVVANIRWWSFDVRHRGSPGNPPLRRRHPWSRRRCLGSELRLSSGSSSFHHAYTLLI